MVTVMLTMMTISDNNIRRKSQLCQEREEILSHFANEILPSNERIQR